MRVSEDHFRVILVHDSLMPRKFGIFLPAARDRVVVEVIRRQRADGAIPAAVDEPLQGVLEDVAGKDGELVDHVGHGEEDGAGFLDGNLTAILEVELIVGNATASVHAQEEGV